MPAGVALTGTATANPAPAAGPAAEHGRFFPSVIPLPNGWQPEGIATGRGTSFYVGSLRDGSIYKGDLATGAGAVLVAGAPGRVAVGIEVDRRNRLFVAGGPSGAAAVYDARTGAVLASYQPLPAGAGFINDVVVTRDAAYFTDSINPVLYVARFGPGGALPATLENLPYSGELVYEPGFNVNGIEATPDGRRLIVVQTNTGRLFSVSPATGATRLIDLGGAVLTGGDGLLRRGTTLYVVQNVLNQVAVVRLHNRLSSGLPTGSITDPRLDVPTTVAAFGPFLYAVNSRFGTPPTPATEYDVVRLPAR